MSLFKKHIMPASLTDKDIMRLVEGEANIVDHREIGKYDNILSLMGPHKACIILYVMHDTPQLTYGHWCCVFLGPEDKEICYFDSCGFEPDHALGLKDIKLTRDPYLSMLLQKAMTQGWKVDYNNYPLQKLEKGNNICGRMVGLRLQMRNLSPEQFVKIMRSEEKKGIDPGELCSIMTSFIN